MRFRGWGGVTPNGCGWSREQFADRVGINPNYLGEIEMGEKEAGWMILGSMCEVLHCTPGDLMGGIEGCREEVHRRHDDLAKVHSQHRGTNGPCRNGHHGMRSL